MEKNLKMIKTELNLILKKISISPEEDFKIKKKVETFLESLKKILKNIDAKIFIGGSFAKGTSIKKEMIDVDIFLRFNKNYTEKEISKLMIYIMKNFKEAKKIHGSRDYLIVSPTKELSLELIPVLSITKPKEAQNITDLSYFHVAYLKKKTKSKKILEEIKLTKAFCTSCGCYGAESFIHGFSGYSLELLIIYYKSFLKLIKEISKKSEKKIVIDIEKKFKKASDIFLDLNGAKLDSPIILIDPTYKYRNVTASLSKETFEKFQKYCKSFLKKPSEKYFRKSVVNLEKIKKEAERKNYEFINIKTTTDKQEGSIAGSKLHKFHKILKTNIERLFYIKKSGFIYDLGKISKNFFVLKRKSELLFSGPFIKDENNVKKFKKRHRRTFEKNGRVYSKEENKWKIKEFINFWEEENKKLFKDMNITEIKVLN